MRIKNYAAYVKAMQLAAEEIQKEYHRRKEEFDQKIDQVPFYHECYNFRPNLTTAQKMRVYKFIRALETAEEL
jgi:hypothetical protein